MSPKMSRKMLRKMSKPRSSAQLCTNVEVCSNVEACSNVEVCNGVEERRFSAASSAMNDGGFSPCGRISRQSFASIALLALTSAWALSAPAQKPAGASATADLPTGPMQAKATTACLECHDARIILQQRLNKATWTKEVDKMVKWGAVVDPADRDALIDYLSTKFSPDNPAYEPHRTSMEKRGTGKT